MRVALVISSLAGGGAERAVTGLANYWIARNHEVAVITWEPDSAHDAYQTDSRIHRFDLDLSIESKRLHGRLLSNMKRALRLRQTVRKWTPHVVLSFMDSTNVICILALVGLRIPVVVSERSDPQRNAITPLAWRVLRRWLYRYAHRIVAQTTSAADWLQKECGADVAVIPNFLRDLPLANSGVMRDRLVVAVGRLSPEKDLPTLIRAFALSQRHVSGWRLVLVGCGPMREELEALVLVCGISAQTSFEGFVPDPERWMARAGIFVLCSRFEGFPNALLEAMAMGAPVVSSICPSAPDMLIVDSLNGRLFRAGDVDGLCVILEELMQDPKCRSSLGREAVKCRDKYSLDRVMAVWDSLIDGIICGDS